MVKIDSFKFGEMDIEGKTYYSDVMMFWDGKVQFLPKFKIFGMNLLAKLMKRNPMIIVIGTGEKGTVKIAPEVRQACEDQKIKLYTDPTGKAVDFFNGLVLQGKKVAAAFNVTF